ncbi:helix-turn-helix domain-containing protein [Streptomyces sp. NPDC018019]|uniref:helix-turn-helix domain-containing protein n=1 Tax=Streptomyces sp. NPDC018019 TaxID=3365030 RepID=UPI00378C457A
MRQHPLSEQIAALLRAGESNIGVARKLGVDRDTVARHRRRLGLPGYRTTAASTHCRHGHPFAGNTGYSAEGWRYCLACVRERDRARKRRDYVPGARPPRPSTARSLDEVAVQRAAAGDPPDTLSPRERAAAIRALRGQLTAQVIAERVRCSVRTVYRRTGAAA